MKITSYRIAVYEAQDTLLCAKGVELKRQRKVIISTGRMEGHFSVVSV